MDAGVLTALTAGIGDFATDATAQLAAVLPVGLTVAISVAVLFMGIRWFRSIAHV